MKFFIIGNSCLFSNLVPSPSPPYWSWAKVSTGLGKYFPFKFVQSESASWRPLAGLDPANGNLLVVLCFHQPLPTFDGTSSSAHLLMMSLICNLLSLILLLSTLSHTYIDIFIYIYIFLSFTCLHTFEKC